MFWAMHEVLGYSTSAFSPFGYINKLITEHMSTTDSGLGSKFSICELETMSLEL